MSILSRIKDHDRGLEHTTLRVLREWWGFWRTFRRYWRQRRENPMVLLARYRKSSSWVRVLALYVPMLFAVGFLTFLYLADVRAQWSPGEKIALLRIPLLAIPLWGLLCALFLQREVLSLERQEELTLTHVGAGEFAFGSAFLPAMSLARGGAVFLLVMAAGTLYLLHDEYFTLMGLNEEPITLASRMLLVLMLVGYAVMSAIFHPRLGMGSRATRFLGALILHSLILLPGFAYLEFELSAKINYQLIFSTLGSNARLDDFAFYAIPMLLLQLLWVAVLIPLRFRLAGSEFLRATHEDDLVRHSSVERARAEREALPFLRVLPFNVSAILCPVLLGHLITWTLFLLVVFPLYGVFCPLVKTMMIPSLYGTAPARSFLDSLKMGYPAFSLDAYWMFFAPFLFFLALGAVLHLRYRQERLPCVAGRPLITAFLYIAPFYAAMPLVLLAAGNWTEFADQSHHIVRVRPGMQKSTYICLLFSTTALSTAAIVLTVIPRRQRLLMIAFCCFVVGSIRVLMLTGELLQASIPPQLLYPDFVYSFDRRDDMISPVMLLIVHFFLSLFILLPLAVRRLHVLEFTRDDANAPRGGTGGAV